LCDGVILDLSFLALECERDAVQEFKVWMGMREDHAIFEESDVAHFKDLCLAVFGLGDFEILAGSKGKEHPKPCELDDGAV
jgi:hypothetical protein